MAITVTATVQEFSAVVGPQLQRELGLAAREAVNLAAKAVAAEATRNLKAVLGPDQKLSGLGGRGKPIKVRVSYARFEVNPMAVVRPTGPWWLIERSRAGGYDIRPKARGSRGRPHRPGRSAREIMATTEQRIATGAIGHAPALKVGAQFYSRVTGGAITAPRAPITRTFKRAQAIVERTARDAVEKRLRRRYG